MVCAAASTAVVKGNRDKSEERITKVAITSVRKWMKCAFSRLVDVQPTLCLA
jgi:hypothetical protein